LIFRSFTPIPGVLSRKGQPMVKLVALIAIVIGLFVFLPTTPAAVWSAIPMLLVFGLMFDAHRRGQRLLARQGAKEDTLVETSRMIGYVAMFHVMWVGFQGGDSGPMQDGMGGDYAGGAELGGFDGGFDGGGSGGGDAGGGGF
jgi:hypothetical protein